MESQTRSVSVIGNSRAKRVVIQRTAKNCVSIPSSFYCKKKTTQSTRRAKDRGASISKYSSNRSKTPSLWIIQEQKTNKPVEVLSICRMNRSRVSDIKILKAKKESDSTEREIGCSIYYSSNQHSVTEGSSA